MKVSSLWRPCVLLFVFGGGVWPTEAAPVERKIGTLRVLDSWNALQVETLSRALEKTPDDAVLLNARGLAWQKVASLGNFWGERGQQKLADADFARALLLQPKNADLVLAQALSLPDDFEAATMLAALSTRANTPPTGVTPNRKRALLDKAVELGNAQARQERAFFNARALFWSIGHQKPGGRAAFTAFEDDVRALSQTANFDLKRLAVWRAGVMMSLGVLAPRDKEKYEAPARAVLENVAQSAPQIAHDAMSEVAIALDEADVRPLAALWLQSAAQVSAPQNSPFYFLLQGQILAREKNWVSAQKNLELARARFEQNDPRLPQTLELLSLAEAALGRPALAIERAQSALYLGGQTRGWNRIGDWQLQLGQFKNAADSFAVAAQFRFPDDGAPALKIALAKTLGAEPDAAKTYQQEIQNADKADLVAHDKMLESYTEKSPVLTRVRAQVKAAIPGAKEAPAGYSSDFMDLVVK